MTAAVTPWDETGAYDLPADAQGVELASALRPALAPVCLLIAQLGFTFSF